MKGDQMMANTNPTIDNLETLEYVLNKSKITPGHMKNMPDIFRLIIPKQKSKGQIPIYTLRTRKPPPLPIAPQACSHQLCKCKRTWM